MADEVVEGTAVDVPDEGPPGSSSPAPGALVQSSPSVVLRPLAVAEVTQAMEEYQKGLHAILDESDWQDAGRGEKFVKKSGWRKVATWFGLSVQIVRERIERDEEGEPLRASVVARAVAPNGRFMEGDGHCSTSESRFKRSGGRAKLENDLIGTATTRAKNRAIADLVGMGAVSAEEMEDQQQQQGPPFGEPANAELETKLAAALQVLVGPEKITVAAEKLETDAGGYLPRIVARAVCFVAFVAGPQAESTQEKEQEVGSSDSSEAGDGAGAGDGGDTGAEPEAVGVGADAGADAEGA